LLFTAWTTSVQLFGDLLGQTGLLEKVSQALALWNALAAPTPRVACAVVPLGPDAEAGLGPSVPALWTPNLRRTAFLSHSPCATRRAPRGRARRPCRRRPLRSLPYRRTRRHRTTPMLRPGRHGELANRLSSSRPSIKVRRCSSSRSTVPPWPPSPPPASSIFRVCSRPTNYPGTSTRTPCSPSSRLLSWPDRRFAGARATAAATALRRRIPTPAWSPAQPKFQTGAHRVVERPTATSCLGRRANSPEQAYPRPSPDAAIELARRYCLRRNSGRQCIRSEPLAVIPHLPGLIRRRSCRNLTRTAAG
jgi:hypothetical protein